MTADNGRPAVSRRTNETFLPRDQETLPLPPHSTHLPDNQDLSGRRIESPVQNARWMSRPMSPMFEDSQRIPRHDVRPYANSDISGELTSAKAADREYTRGVAAFSRAPSLTDHHAALMLEDLAFNRTNNVERQNPEKTGEYSSFVDDSCLAEAVLAL